MLFASTMWRYKSYFMQNDIKNALEVLRNGGVILYPTDTIWGIGCDATNADAVKRVYEIKQRTDNKAMLVLLENPNRLNSYVDVVPDVAWDLIDATDKPMTIIYPGAKNLAPNLVGEDKTIGIRITEERRGFYSPIDSAFSQTNSFNFSKYKRRAFACKF